MKKLLLGLIGAGIQRSMSPALHEEEGRHHGLRVHYQLIDLDGAASDVLPRLIQAARVMGFAGLNITFPCKQAVIPLLDALSDEANAIGAVNTVVREGDRLVGYNTDAPGWSWGFQRALPKADLSRVVLLGAGGAGAAVGYAALELGVAELSIFDVDPSRAAALASHLGPVFRVKDSASRRRPCSRHAVGQRADPCHPDRHGGAPGHAARRAPAAALDVGLGGRLRAAGNRAAQGGAPHRLRDRRRRAHERRPGDPRLQAVYRPATPTRRAWTRISAGW